jgi:hypothetical protein
VRGRQLCQRVVIGTACGHAEHRTVSAGQRFTGDSGFAGSMGIADGRVARGERCTGAGCGDLKVPLTVWCVRGGARLDAQ